MTGQKVLIGGADKDDYSKITVTDQDGNTVKADITVDDSHAGKRVVKAHVLNPVSGQYTLNVPQSATPTGTDYTIPDDSQACWTGDEYGNADKSHCQTGNSEQVGKITVTDQSTYVAVARELAREAVRKLTHGKVKGKTVKVRALEE